MPSLRDRRRIVTDEPYRIEPALLGRPLASFRRRAAAFVIDLALVGALIVVLFVGLTALSFHRSDGRLFADLWAARAAPEAERPARYADVGGRFLAIMVERDPGLLDDEARAVLDGGGPAALWTLLNPEDGGTNLTIVGGASKIVVTPEGRRLQLGTDALMGGMANLYNVGFLFVAWFTAATRLGRGRTAGKLLARTRVVRLDGRPLSWWDCFGRAGGYSASAATALLGFLEAIWHPNRQTIHDRIAGTVVVRDPVPTVKTKAAS